MTARKQLTTAHGSPISDNQNSLTAGPRGPLLMQDFQLLEKMATFNRERVPERVVHAKGSGAYGTFTVTNDVSQYTKASIFSHIGKQTDCLLRFSTVAGERGAADAERDVRGFAVKFYTDEGNWDMVGNNTPVFFVRDPYKFGDFIHTQKRDPKTNMRSSTAMWDFWSLSPESLHQVTILMSDRGLPQGYRFVNGYSSHTYSFINADNERFWIKLHFKTMQGIKPGPTPRPPKLSAPTAKVPSAISLKPSSAATIQSGASAFRSCPNMRRSPTMSIHSTSRKSGPTLTIP